MSYVALCQGPQSCTNTLSDLEIHPEDLWHNLHVHKMQPGQLYRVLAGEEL